MSNYPYVSSRVITNTFVNKEYTHSICYNQANVNYNTPEAEQRMADRIRKYKEAKEKQDGKTEEDK